MQTIQRQAAHPMDELKNKLRQILQAIPPGSQVYYIDYPVYANGGDLLIMKGTEAFFREHGIHVSARYSAHDFPDRLPIPQDAILVLQGGGNFGDLYPVHQKLRERVVERYPGHRVVILPQTIYYRSVFEWERTAAILSRHPDLHLFVRDVPSLDMAKERLDARNVYLSPDMAHQLWPIRSPVEPDKELLRFLRTDIEQSAEQQRWTTGESGDCLDWPTLYGSMERKSIRLLSGMLRSGIAVTSASRLWGRYADYLVKKAIQRFGRYRAVQTSRLHGHILSCLMNKPNVLLDNAYGKNAGYYSAWTSSIATAQLRASPANGKNGGIV